MRIFVSVLLFLVTAPQAIVTPSPAVLEFDLRTLGGDQLRQLAWSPDGTQMYLQTYDANRDASVKTLFHSLLPTAGGTPARIDQPPAWADAYWAWKSGQSAPGDSTWKIEISTDKEIAHATSAPAGGEMARGGVADPTGGISVESATATAAQATNLNVYTLRLSGETIGQWTNHPIMPGVTFGWGPPNSGLMAFATKDGGKLVLMNRAGKTTKVDGTKNVFLPAFSADGNRLAYLEQRGRTKYALVIATVSNAR